MLAQLSIHGWMESTGVYSSPHPIYSHPHSPVPGANSRSHRGEQTSLRKTLTKSLELNLRPSYCEAAALTIEKQHQLKGLQQVFWGVYMQKSVKCFWYFHDIIKKSELSQFKRQLYFYSNKTSFMLHFARCIRANTVDRSTFKCASPKTLSHRCPFYTLTTSCSCAASVHNSTAVITPSCLCLWYHQPTSHSQRSKKSWRSYSAPQTDGEKRVIARRQNNSSPPSTRSPWPQPSTVSALSDLAVWKQDVNGNYRAFVSWCACFWTASTQFTDFKL